MKLKKLLTTAGLAFSFSLFLGLSAKAADGTTMETATTLSLDGEAHKNGMTEDNYVYWYKCTIPNDIGNKWVNFSCTNNINQRVEFTVYDAEETALDSHTLDTKESWTLKCKVPDSAASEDFPLTEPGKTYYIKAEGYIADSASGKYTVQIKTVSDDNWGTMEQAPEFTIGQKTSGTLEMYGDIDYYKFTIPEIPEDEDQIYTLSLAGSNNCTAAVLDADDIERDSLSGTSDEKFSESLEISFTEGGTYYIKIYDANQEVTKTSYSFKLSKGQSSEKISVTPSKTDDTQASEKDTTTKKTIKMVLVKAKKNNKKFTISSLKNAKFVVTTNRNIIKNGTKKVKKITKTEKSGVLTVNLSKKLKKGDVIKVTVSRSGYKTKTVTTKIK